MVADVLLALLALGCAGWAGLMRVRLRGRPDWPGCQVCAQAPGVLWRYRPGERSCEGWYCCRACSEAGKFPRRKGGGS